MADHRAQASRGAGRVLHRLADARAFVRRQQFSRSRRRPRRSISDCATRSPTLSSEIDALSAACTPPIHAHAAQVVAPPLRDRAQAAATQRQRMASVRGGAAGARAIAAPRPGPGAATGAGDAAPGSRGSARSRAGCGRSAASPRALHRRAPAACWSARAGRCAPRGPGDGRSRVPAARRGASSRRPLCSASLSRFQKPWKLRPASLSQR